MKVGHGNQSQHYAGVAFDVGQTLSTTKRNQLWNSANNSRSNNRARNNNQSSSRNSNSSSSNNRTRNNNKESR